MKEKMKELKKSMKSVRVRLFFTMSITVLAVIMVLIVLNNVVLETYYIYSKDKALKDLYISLNQYYSAQSNIDLNSELEKIAVRNNFDILIKDENNNSIYTSNKNFFVEDLMYSLKDSLNKNKINEQVVLEETNEYNIRKITDENNSFSYVVLDAKLDNGYYLFARIPINSIQESVNISNKFLYSMAGIIILVCALMITIVSRKFAEPILELNKIAKKMSNLDFSDKYKCKGKEDDEINALGNSINVMSDKLEGTINQLRNTNNALERDIEEKSKIDEMRKSFISDVSHELKTPIALIQGYSEGLLENVNSDEESKKFYAEVILDETNKMDKLVKQLLELMKLEYGKREFNNSVFDIVEEEKEIIRKSKVMLEEEKIKTELDSKEVINVFADDFYIEQVMTNYFTNAIKHVKEVDGEKIIKISNKIDKENNIVRIGVFNTGDCIPEEEENKIWNRFYKADESRKREDGGTGIGLSLVKAIMNNYNNKFGMINKDNGVEFYFELDLEKKKKDS